MSITPMALRGLPPLWRESRFPRELAALQRDLVYRGRGVPHGHGPALLIPGFMAGDSSLQTMTGWMRRLGYRTSRAGIRLNADCASAALDRLEARLEGLVERYEQGAVIVGQSRGGTFARALAARRPDLVSGIVTLGSPLIDELAVHPLVMLNVRMMSKLGAAGLPGLFTPDCVDGECCAELRNSLAEPFPRGVGFVSIYSRSDGIVDWHACLDPAAEHVEVESSHCGMSVNAGVYRVAARALAEFSDRGALPVATAA